MLVILALIAGIAKCWSVSRRPATNTKCVMALGLLLVAFLIPNLSQTASAIVPVPFGELADFVSLAVTLASAVLALVGLREYGRGRSAYKQGKAQAIWALALSALVAAYPILSLAQSKWNILSIEKPRLTAQALEFTNFNFRFFVPGEPWSQTEGDPLDLKPALTLRYAGSAELHFAVVAQPASNRKQTPEQLETVATNTLSKTLDDLRVVSRLPIRKDALQGIEVDMEVGHRGQTLYVENRLFDGNGWIYQLITWVPNATRRLSWITHHLSPTALNYSITTGQPPVP